MATLLCRRLRFTSVQDSCANDADHSDQSDEEEIIEKDLQVDLLVNGNAIYDGSECVDEVISNKDYVHEVIYHPGDCVEYTKDVVDAESEVNSNVKPDNMSMTNADGEEAEEDAQNTDDGKEVNNNKYIKKRGRRRTRKKKAVVNSISYSRIQAGNKFKLAENGKWLTTHSTERTDKIVLVDQKKSQWKWRKRKGRTMKNVNRMSTDQKVWWKKRRKKVKKSRVRSIDSKTKKLGTWRRKKVEKRRIRYTQSLKDKNLVPWRRIKKSKKRRVRYMCLTPKELWKEETLADPESACRWILFLIIFTLFVIVY